MKYQNAEHAMTKINRNAGLYKYGLYNFVQVGTAGNGTLGAIDYVNNYTNVRIMLVRNLPKGARRY